MRVTQRKPATTKAPKQEAPQEQAAPKQETPATETRGIPAMVHKTTEPMEMDAHTEKTVVLSSEKDNTQQIRDRNTADGVIDTRPVVDQEKIAMLAFFNQKVKVHIHTTTDEKAEQIFEFCINGRSYMFRRGETKVVPRFVVDRMARCRPTSYTHRETVAGNGEKQVVYDPHQGLRYPFSIVEDPHPRGKEWLEAVLREPA